MSDDKGKDVSRSPAGTRSRAKSPGTSKKPGAAQEVVVTRRLMVGFLLAGAGATPAIAKGLADAVTGSRTTVQTPRGPFSNPPADLTSFALLRPDDLLNLQIRLVNLVVAGSGAQRSIRCIDASQPAIMVVTFPPQAIAEGVYPDTLGQTSFPKINREGGVGGTAVPADVGGGPINSTMAAPAYIAGPSRLAYLMPAGTSSIPFTVADVLNACATWPLNLDSKAGTAPASQVAAHDFDRTRLRMIDVVGKYRAQLVAYGPGVEALLTRAAQNVADAIARAAGEGLGLNDVSIDALIAYEIKATLNLTLTQDERANGPSLILDPTTKKTVQAYVSAAATQQLVDMAQAKSATQAPDLTGKVATAGLSATPSVVTYDDSAPRPIADNATDIEVPFRMHMTPLATAGFTHASNAVDQGGPFVELWHTRMGTRIDEWVLSENPEPLRALWADDFKGGINGGDWALSSLDRMDMVRLMSGDYHNPAAANPNYTPLPAIATYLRLSALGASMEADGNWPDHETLNSNLAAWKHINSIGRDQYVRVIYDGYLFPFGHAASLIKVSERKFSRQTDGGRVAGLMQKFYIVVRQRLRTFPGDHQAHDGRDFPFTTVEITTRQTADLAAPAKDGGLGTGYFANPNPADHSYVESDHYFETFWPELISDGSDMIFHLVGTDSQGRKTVFEMPLLFVAGTRNDDSDVTKTNSNLDAIMTLYASAATLARRTVTLNHSLIRFSPDTDPSGAPLGPGESDYHASEIKFAAAKSTAKLSGPQFYPSVSKATIEVPSVKNLLGSNVNPEVQYHSRFLDSGFDAGGNPAHMVFSFAAQTVTQDPSHPTNTYGGLLTPSLAPDGLSRKLGALTNSAAYAAGSFDPSSALPAGANLLGIIPLKTILNIVSDFSGDLGAVPHLKTVTDGDTVTTTYTLVQHTVNAFSSTPLGDIFVPLTVPDDSDQLSIVTTVVVAKSGQAPQASVAASLKNFKINLFGFIIIDFDLLSMTVNPGSKPDVTPTLNADDGVTFGGPLEFVNTLSQIIPMSGFSDPPGIDVTPAGLTASYSLGLPDIGIGVLSLSNISLGAGFDLPFTGGGPSVRFNFAERQNPFNLTVSLFGGGGFFAITLDTGGVRELEVSLEFGAQISIDLGVASGGVYIKGGFYFCWEDSPTHLVQFEGYVELGGHLNILGLIVVSLVFHIGLTYQKAGHVSSLYGTATLTVEIDILFFSISQSVSITKQFAGSDSDPSFLLFVPTAQPWIDYCDAFA